MGLNKNIPQASEAEKEFLLTEKDYQFIQKLAYDETGIVLSDQKRDMVYARLVRRLRKLQLKNFSEYCEYLQKNFAIELTDFVNSITTNLTFFFREEHHFEMLVKLIIPEIQKANKTEKRIRVWSAGSSTGEEPYSIAMTLSELTQLSNWDVKVLATDLDSNVLATGMAGIYSEERIQSIDKTRIKKFFKPHDTDFQVVDSVKSMISFKQLNLMQEWPMSGKFDLIFCRNVVIYFDKETQKKLFNRYADYLNENGYLIIGHSESLHGVSDRFKLVGKTVYKKIK